jgi:hypothetical protein
LNQYPLGAFPQVSNLGQKRLVVWNVGEEKMNRCWDDPGGLLQVLKAAVVQTNSFIRQRHDDVTLFPLLCIAVPGSPSLGGPNVHCFSSAVVREVLDDLLGFLELSGGVGDDPLRVPDGALFTVHASGLINPSFAEEFFQIVSFRIDMLMVIPLFMPRSWLETYRVLATTATTS